MKGAVRAVSDRQVHRGRVDLPSAVPGAPSDKPPRVSLQMEGNERDGSSDEQILALGELAFVIRMRDRRNVDALSPNRAAKRHEVTHTELASIAVQVSRQHPT
jgi:hypothetical protein